MRNSNCNKIGKKAAILLLFFNFFILGCTSLHFQKQLDFSHIEDSAKTFEWETIAPGIFTSKISYSEYPLIVHAVKIDLSNPAVKVRVTEDKMFDKKGAVTRETVLSFARRHNTVIALNAAFFKTGSVLFSKKAVPIGVHIYKGKLLSLPEKKYGAVYFLKNGYALIAESQDLKLIPNDTVYSVSGFKMIIRDNEVIKTNIHAVEDSRTCIGIADKGKTVFLFFAEGENKRKSRGLTYDEASFFMKKLGSSNAIHLDGGGSSSLVIRKGKKFYKIVPSISSLGLRKTATNLGFIFEQAEQ